jgi:chromate reductase, NAD(P)H dehydrogenase (quinone)
VSTILLISGSTRSASTNSAFVRTAAAIDERAVLYDGLSALPHFNPDDDVDPLAPRVAELRAAIARSDAVLFCTPEYAGTLPGSFKNLLDWTVGGTEIAGKPVTRVNIAADPQRGAGATATLLTVLGYVQGDVVEAACRHIPVARDAVGADGLITDPEVHAAIRDVLAALV